MTVRVQCHACACVFAMPKGLRPTELSAWMGWHAAECEIDGQRDLTVLAVDDSTHDLEVREVDYAQVQCAVRMQSIADDAYVSEGESLLLRACAMREAMRQVMHEEAWRRGAHGFYVELADWIAKRVASRRLRRRHVDVGEAMPPSDLAPRIGKDGEE
jgi:hypothetical protein